MRSIAVVGPTASGKTQRAVAIASRLGGEIISADSRQVYRGMTIGTGKDLEDYGSVPYHLIDVAEAGEKYNLHRFLKDFNTVYDRLVCQNVTPVICGGSGMYVENAIKGVSLPDVPENPQLRASLEGKSIGELAEILAGYKTLHNTTDIDTAKRAVRAIEIQEYYSRNPELAAFADVSRTTPRDCLVIGVDLPREVRRERITRRLLARLDQGMVDEIRQLLDDGIKPDDLIYYGLEYKFVTLYVTGKLSYEQMVHDLEIAIHQFAKRQMTWFRGMETRGTRIHWLPYALTPDQFADEAIRLLGS